MKIYKVSTRDSQTIYTRYEGFNDSTVIELMTAIGHTSIQDCTEQDYLDAANS